ncbi:MAG: SGNH/GDSL hydrolase family protein, partial [Myxococcota bacterium]
MWKRIVVGVLFLAVIAGVSIELFLEYMQGAATDPAFFESEIVAFEAEDAKAPPPPGGVVFVGSSSIRFWNSLTEDMAPVPVVRRGFGGAQMSHLLHNVHRVVTPYAPSRVVVYAGDNDLAAGSEKSADDVVDQYRRLVSEIHTRVPAAKVDFIAIKPSTLRWEEWPEMNRANRAIAALAEEDPRLGYFDIATPMIGPDGRPRGELFRMDGLHLSPEGYAVWTDVVRPPLEADFEL